MKCQSVISVVLYICSTHNESMCVLQNIIKKVSGQKFVYKFVSQPDPAMHDGIRNVDQSQRTDTADPVSLSKCPGGVASPYASKSLSQVPVSLTLMTI